MTRRLHFPIAGKIIIVTLTVLLAAVIPIAFNASELFRDKFGEREAYANMSQTQTRSAQIEAILRNIQEKSSTLGKLVLQRYAAHGNNPTSEEFLKSLEEIRFIFNRGGDLISLKVYHRDGKKTVLVANLVNQDTLKNYNLKPSFLDTLDKVIKPPLAAALAGEVTTKNRSVVGKLGILTIGLPIAKSGNGQVTHAVLADISLAPIQQSFRNTGERTIYLVDKSGVVLAHPQEKLALKHTSFAKVPVVKQAINSPMAQGQLRYQDKDTGQFNISAFSRTSFGLSVISEASESVILEPARLVQREALFITGLVVSAAFFIIFLFSLTLTRPIEKLVQLTKVVATGNFDVDPGNIAKARDEVGTLATAFGAMLHGLREREKVKALFNKFHGSSVTESLLANDQVSIGGTKRAVVVLFSDIRSFTSYSESRKPEEVVSMLNEYFGYMVNVIHKNHGVVDKFIGDAIMAVWGAPQSTGDDTYHAVRAAIDMRLALADLNKIRIGRGEDPIMIGAGLHCGEAISGTIGSENRMEYTVIGNTVNTTSRIEASTKAFGADLLISEDLANKVKERFMIELAGKTEVKGRSEVLSLFKVKGTIAADGKKDIVSTPYSDYEAEAADKVKLVS
ncbi:MAG: HAMP domain-containing protein [Deltaproteobacteria bacterium]|nr:HAMP domain-containing protein [Deltaproteobacteria bacterium]